MMAMLTIVIAAIIHASLASAYAAPNEGTMLTTFHTRRERFGGRRSAYRRERPTADPPMSTASERGSTRNPAARAISIQSHVPATAAQIAQSFRCSVRVTSRASAVRMRIEKSAVMIDISIVDIEDERAERYHRNSRYDAAATAVFLLPLANRSRDSSIGACEENGNKRDHEDEVVEHQVAESFHVRRRIVEES